MTKQQQTSKKQKSKFQVKENSAKSLVYGTIIATLIALTPYIFTFYESVPNVKVWDTFCLHIAVTITLVHKSQLGHL